ncbi:uncharacterized protein An15g05980 [Aspergillus niger]|uniref:Contig An15c0200, genomic contig n=2 Tax=Aspergillus niger TaxID=5061 RepID=A2R5Y4_ASPNC|nr:uncharacterized protein An15g05980 [Aspergillus niger]CAK42551.1 unnamed protein product [Aspergillus niger]
MASLRPGPTEAISVSSGSSSTPQYTPVSDRSENDGSPNPNRPTAGSLRVQTAFSSDGESFTDDGFDEGYESYEDVQPLSSSRTSMPKYTKEEEKGVIKQFDRKLVPFLALLYLLSFLDRSNIGNAKIAGLADDLHLSSSQYEWLLTAFYITYILFEWMTLMYKVVPPHIYIALCVCGWGLVASLQSLATSFGALVFLRAALGITEAAFGPGVPFYLSLFYKREELAFRNGLFISAAPLASSFASSLAWLIVRVSDNGPIAPWRTLFLVEGFPSIIVAVFAWVVIPDTPGSASFLNPRQRAIAQLRMDELKPNHRPHQQQSQQRKSFNWKEVKKTLADPKSYITAHGLQLPNIPSPLRPTVPPLLPNRPLNIPPLGPHTHAQPLPHLPRALVRNRLRRNRPGGAFPLLPPISHPRRNSLPGRLPRHIGVLLRHHANHHLDHGQPARERGEGRQRGPAECHWAVRAAARHEAVSGESGAVRVGLLDRRIPACSDYDRIINLSTIR